jgi:hypothetical protein
MKITIYQSERDWVPIEDMYIDGKYREHVGGGEPEDQMIGRDLVSCCAIADYMQQAYDAGKRGDDFVVEIIEGESPEDN